MKVERQPRLARRFFDRFEPVHAVTYFSPECRAAFDGLGFRGFWMGYFAGRSAPLGIVPTEVVTALFYNFAPSRVAKALPAAWEIASPGAALRARADSAIATLRRYGLSDDGVRTAAELAGKAARGAPLDGRPLFAANLALPWPSEPRWPSSGMRSRCFGNSAATGTWPCWPQQVCPAVSPMCCTPRQVGCRER